MNAEKLSPALDLRAFDLIKRAVQFPVQWKLGEPRWSAVSRIFNVGCTSATLICQAVGEDACAVRTRRSMKRLALTIATGLLLSVAIWHVQANAPRDWPEHALALACRMTFNDSGGGDRPAVLDDYDRIKRPGSNLTGAIEPGLRSSFAEPVSRFTRPAVTYFLRMLGLPRMRTTPVELRP